MVTMSGLKAPLAELAAPIGSLAYSPNEGTLFFLTLIVVPLLSIPVLVKAFDNHTKGTRPVKIPTPPRIKVL